MSILDKKYKTIDLDLILIKSNESLDMVFSISDNETSDFYIKITKNDIEIDLSGFKTELWVLREDGTTEKMDLVQENELGLFYCNLSRKFKDRIGKYKAQVKIKDSNTLEEILTRSKFYYEVIDDIPNVENPVEPGKVEIAFTIYDDETGEEKIVNASSTGDINEVTLEEVTE